MDWLITGVLMFMSLLIGIGFGAFITNNAKVQND